ncbi:MAG TPA: murein L,D-transpeptidase family protein [Candidatus Competibacteraceae bacterium]|nr:murein L,D-transpeptidase family protein [Candidatus Competibacteraceae bacterium]
MGLRWSSLLLCLAVGGCASKPPAPPAPPPVVKAPPVSLQGRLQAAGLNLGDPVFMRIFKEEAQLEVWMQQQDGRYKLFRSYPICKYSGDLGPKQREGDKQSPEGFYYVTLDRMNPNSQFYLSFNLGFPNAYDRAHGYTGSALMVHGDCVSIGCYAMTDRQIQEIYTLAEAALKNGQPYFRVHAFPFRLTPHNLARHKNSPWFSFWANLKEGYDYFEQHKLPPEVYVEGLAYRFAPSAPTARVAARSAKADGSAN